jgi:hypothetical protein
LVIDIMGTVIITAETTMATIGTAVTAMAVMV